MIKNIEILLKICIIRNNFYVLIQIYETNNNKNLFESIIKKFDLKNNINLIEVYDNSHIQGTNSVGAMVTFGEEGFIKKRYRKFFKAKCKIYCKMNLRMYKNGDKDTKTLNNTRYVVNNK